MNLAITVLFSQKSDNFTHNQAIFLTILFIAFNFIILFDLKSGSHLQKKLFALMKTLQK